MTKNNDKVLYAAFKRKDPNFDGRFFVGISSTGIYCRPVCKARQPKPENCSFYATAAAAEHAGFRPCLLCRPELAPGNALVDAKASLAYRAARLMEESCGDGESIAAIAKRLGCSDRHLRRAFLAELKVPPVQYLQTCRLLLAKNLLTSTKLSVIDIAMAAGFGSLRRFNDLFQKRYRLAPTGLRRQTLNEKSHDDTVTVLLGYRPPYPFTQMLQFLDDHAIPGVELVKNAQYFRTAQFKTNDGRYIYGWLKVAHNPQKNALALTITATLLPVLPQVLTRVRHLFDLYCQPEPVYQTLKSMDDIKPGLCVLGARVPGCFNTFELVVRTVVGQQITIKAASTLAGRLVSAFGKPIQTEIDGLSHTFPTSEAIALLSVDNLGSLGIIGNRSRTILELAQAFVSGNIDFSCTAEPAQEMEKMLAIAGIGPWTAQYVAMRAMGWTDAFLETDLGIKKALNPRTPKQMLALADKWRPWRSYATINLWNSL